MAEKLSDVDKQRSLYNDLKAGAESGWDFSGRWFIGPEGEETNNLIDINTMNIIPVDLNSFLQRNARLLVEFHTELNKIEVSSRLSVSSKNLFARLKIYNLL